MFGVNHCVFLNRDGGGGQLLGVSGVVEGGGKEPLRGESLCGKESTQNDPMNIWSLAADCVWALSTHNVENTLQHGKPPQFSWVRADS